MDIAIIGAGIGGLTAALALQNNGHRVRVYERHSASLSPGAGYVIWPNAAFVLTQLGLIDAVALHAGRVTAMKRFDQQGVLLSSLDITLLEALMGLPSYAIWRTDLIQVLLQALAVRDIQIHYHQELVHLEVRESSAWAYFHNSKTITADLIIGADGRMNSVARSFVNPGNPALYQGFINWVGFAESDKILCPAMAIMDFWGVGERFGIVPINDKKVYWAAGAAAGLGEQQKSTNTELAKRFSSWPKVIQRLVLHTPSDAIKAIYVHDLAPINQWHRNRILLLGDAAHACLPTSGQGACQAMEDAWHLANCLADVDGNNLEHVELALNKFGQLRYDKTTRITQSARHLAASIFSTDQNACALRNQRNRNVDSRETVKSMAHFWSEGLPLTKKGLERIP